MKNSKIFLILLCSLFIFPTFGQDKAEQEKELFIFPVTTLEVSKPTSDLKVETKVAAKKDTKNEVVSTTPATLVALDKEAILKDSLVQKYQVILDDVIGRMTNRLNTVSPAEQRIALGDLRDRMSEKKVVVVGMKDLEPLKKDIITAILDHVIYRLE
jgi:hypothetical protein